MQPTDGRTEAGLKSQAIYEWRGRSAVGRQNSSDCSLRFPGMALLIIVRRHLCLDCMYIRREGRKSYVRCLSNAIPVIEMPGNYNKIYARDLYGGRIFAEIYFFVPSFLSRSSNHLAPIDVTTRVEFLCMDVLRV